MHTFHDALRIVVTLLVLYVVAYIITHHVNALSQRNLSCIDTWEIVLREETVVWKVMCNVPTLYAAKHHGVIPLLTNAMDFAHACRIEWDGHGVVDSVHDLKEVVYELRKDVDIVILYSNRLEQRYILMHDQLFYTYELLDGVFLGAAYAELKLYDGKINSISNQQASSTTTSTTM